MKESILLNASIIQLYRMVKLLVLISLSLFFLGCGPKPYTKINFCWTSDHHLSPDQRFLKVNMSPQAVANGIKKWMKERGGEIVKIEGNYQWIARPQTDYENKYAAAQEIVHKEWAAYEANEYREWEDDEWERLQKLSNNQISWVKSMGDYGYRIVVKLGDRSKEVAYQKIVGTYTYNQPQYIYTREGKWRRAGSIPMRMNKYATDYKNMTFLSVIEFFISRDNGQTSVYAVGVPVEKRSSSMASYGKKIEHAVWPIVTGKEEASMIKDAFSYLLKIN